MKKILTILIIFAAILLIFSIWAGIGIYSVAERANCEFSFSSWKWSYAGPITKDGRMINAIFHYRNPFECIRTGVNSMENERAFFMQQLQNNSKQ